jgi:hypothetical protein
MIALVDETQAQSVAQKLAQNGAVRTIITTIQSPDDLIAWRD